MVWVEQHASTEFRALTRIIAGREMVDLAFVDPQIFFRLARDNKCLGLVERHLHLVENAPQDLVDRIRTYVQKSKQQQIKKQIEIAAITRLARESSIPILIAKGPVLSNTLYGDAKIKTSADLDWFIYPEDAFVFYQALTQAGYDNEFSALNFTPKKWRALVNSKHDLSVIHPSRGVKNEIHWAADNNRRFFPSELYAEMMDRRQPALFGNTPIETFRGEDLFLYLCFHGAKHAWTSLNWLADIYTLLNGAYQVDFQQASAVAARYHLSRTIELAVSLSRTLFRNAGNLNDMIIPGEITDLAEHCLRGLTSPIKNKKTRYWSNRIFLDRRVHGSFSVLVSTVKLLGFKPTDMLRVDLPDRFFFLYFVLRPVFWMLKLFQRSSINK